MIIEGNRLYAYRPRLEGPVYHNTEFVIGRPGPIDLIPDSRRPPFGDILYVPTPAVAQTFATALLHHEKIKPNKKTQLVAVAEMPASLEELLDSAFRTCTNIPLFEFPVLGHTPKLDFLLDVSALVDTIVLVRRKNLSGETVACALEETGVNHIRTLPNTHIGFVQTASETAQLFGLNYPDPESVRKLSSKKELHDLQETLGLRVPLQSDLIPNGDPDKPDEDVTVILQEVEKIAQATGDVKDRVVLKTVDGHGSVSVIFVPLNASSEKKAEIVLQHVTDRNVNGFQGTLVEEYMDGVEVGLHVTTIGGKMDIKVTQKNMATGADGLHSEEVGHFIDPRDKIHELAEKLFREPLEKILKKLGIEGCDMSYNVDCKIDQQLVKESRVIEIPPDSLKRNDTYIGEINARTGGAKISELIGVACENPNYAEQVVRANLGESDVMTAIMKSQPKIAAVSATAWYDWDGYLINAPMPFLQNNTWKTHMLKPDAMVFDQTRNALFTDPNQILPDGVIEVVPTIDYLTKGARVVYMAKGNSIQDALQALRYAVADGRDGIVGLDRKGNLFVNDENGEYKPLDLNPQSNFGKFIRSERGLDFHRGKWILAV